MTTMVAGLVKCNQCQRIMAHDVFIGSHGASKIGVFHFCTDICRQAFVKNHTLPATTGHDVLFAAELRKLQA